MQHSIIAAFRNGGKAVVKLVEKGGRRSCLKSYRNLGGSSSCAGVTGEHRGTGMCSALFLWVVSWKGQLQMCLWGPDKVQRRLLTFLLLCMGRCLLLLTDFSGSEPPGCGDRQMVALKAQWLIKHQALKVRGHWPVISHPRSKPLIPCPKESQSKPTS